MKHNDTTEQNKSVINAYPTKELFISILVRDVTIRDAIGDLLDNSVDGALRLRPEGDYQGLKVIMELNAEEDYFRIKDNCGGIPIQTARDYAFRFGRPEGAEQTGHSVGVFGIGMKRALFRLGKKFKVESVARNSFFTMEVDVEEWKKDDIGKDGQARWQFKFSEHEEDLEEEHLEEKRGTVITVTDLHPGIQESFGLENDITNLINELQREHLCSIDQGLDITVNGIHLEAPELKLLVSDEFKTAYWERLGGPVKVKIYAGVSEQADGKDGGWYIFCNKRLVLGPDTNKITGWGVRTPIRIPVYHSQFYRFRGYVFLDAEDPRDLPWTTAKTTMDRDSPVWRAVNQQMLVLMRSVIDFLNKIHDEKEHFDNDRIDETPLQDAIDRAKIVPLSHVMSTKTYVAVKFVSPEPAKPGPKSNDKVRISYTIPKTEFELVKEYLGMDKASEIGRKTFEYFFAREIED
ncbi:MAG: ATP-binding protein [Planctomycetes bacterium]|nr:ATP-binding protein [Planctomycetota bacterium]